MSGQGPTLRACQLLSRGPGPVGHQARALSRRLQASSRRASERASRTPDQRRWPPITNELRPTHGNQGEAAMDWDESQHPRDDDGKFAGGPAKLKKVDINAIRPWHDTQLESSMSQVVQDHQALGDVWKGGKRIQVPARH